MNKLRRILTPFLLAAALGSASGPDNGAPAAETYRPDLWNGTASNEALNEFYSPYRPEIDALVLDGARTKGFEINEAFNRPAQKSAELAFQALKSLKAYQRLYNDSAIVEFLVSRLDLNANMLDSMLAESRKLRFGSQAKANCHAYGVSKKLNGPSSPGRDDFSVPQSVLETGKISESFDHYTQRVIAGSIKDGLRFTGATLQTRPGYYSVALFTMPAARHVHDAFTWHQFHYVRQDRDGNWSHKFALGNVTNLDFAGNIMHDPRKADLQNFRFAGFFLVPTGGIDVGPPSRPFVLPDILKQALR